MFFNVNVLFDVLDDVNVLFDALFPSCPAGYTPSPTGCVDVDVLFDVLDDVNVLQR